MNINRPLFGRITINNKTTSLGKGTIGDMITRIHEQYAKAPFIKDTNPFIIEMSFHKLPDGKMLMTREQQLEHEMQSLMNTDLDAKVIDDKYSIREAEEVMKDSLYEEYKVLCDPAKRIGVDNDYILRIKHEYETKYGDLGTTICRWRT